MFQSHPYENQDDGLCYLHLTIFFFNIDSSLLQQNKKLLQSVFLSKLDHRPLFSYIYYETILVWGLT